MRNFEIEYNVYSHDFGILIPCKSGVVWQQQTDGVCCHHICIEGVYLPLDKPYCLNKKEKKVDLLNELQEANYEHKSTKRIWKMIRKELDFEFEEAENPKNQPPNQEGIQWIKITRIKNEYYKDGTLGGIDGLIGSVVCLIYPNCD